MNPENFEYLKEQLKYTGFGDSLSGPLEKAMKEGAPQFQLNFEKEINGKAFVALLNFRKSSQEDRYFFNSYHATLQRTNGEIVDQAFYINNGKGVTAKEAYNLLDGRSVYKELQNKEGQPYQAWLQLDFDKRDKHNNHEVKQYHEGYGYNLKEALSKFSITELDGGEREKQLLHSLQKGNLQTVGMEKEGSIAVMVVEANPQYKSINVYDRDLKPVPRESLGVYQTAERGAHKAAEKKQAVQPALEVVHRKGKADRSPSKGHRA